MHNNYHFFKRLIPELEDKILGFRIEACFSQQKDELILGMTDGQQEFYIKADLNQQFTCISFPQSFSRARKNSIDLFNPLIGQTINGVRLFENERCFCLNVGEYDLLFKMYGNRSNLLLMKGEKVIDLFKHRMKLDLELNLGSLDRKIDQSKEAFFFHNGNYSILFPTLGKLPVRHLNDQGYNEMDLEHKWDTVYSLMDGINQSKILIVRVEHQLFLSLVPVGKLEREYNGAIEALNMFYSLRIKTGALDSEKKQLIGELNNRIRKSNNYIKKCKEKLKGLKGSSYRQIADLLMANLHAIPKDAKEIELLNFYTNQPEKITLNPRLSPQKNAERFYRKAKNQIKEEEILSSNIDAKVFELKKLDSDLKKADTTEDLRTIRELAHPYLKSMSKVKEETLPYKKIEIDSFEIFIGRNAKANDKLTFDYSARNDLWLHARDVPGSHVVLRDKPGQSVPPYILEQAAGIAAYHSKRKNDGLCPVIYVERKYVRKFKGAKPGQVRVDHEKIIMVKPLKS